MTHPDLDRLTAWVHGFLEAAEAREADAHVAGCAACRDTVEGLRDEARLLSRAIAAPERLSALKEGLLQAASGKRSHRGLLWQIPLAAAVLIGLVTALLSPGSRHSLVDGRVALEDGRVVSAPLDFAASQSWQLHVVDRASVRLSDRSTVDLGPGARISLAPGGARGVLPDLAAGEASFSVAPDPKRLSIVSPAGRVEAADGRFSVRIVFEEEGGVPVKNALAGAIVTVFAGSVALSNANGSVEAQPGQSAALARAEAPLLMTSPQGQQEELLRRLEQLAARVAKLEDEVTQLEQKNKQLKQQLGSNVGPGGAVWTDGAGQSGVRIQTGPGGAVAPGSVIIIEEGDEKKPERKNPAPQEKK
ncbi:MAG TPA: FecR domain-containing protein [Planctomycetota bacterium]|jgi:anti-sigma factor RsiW|nr:FecR domain-containing protein [Planctomycetota bacterium]